MSRAEAQEELAKVLVRQQRPGKAECVSRPQAEAAARLLIDTLRPHEGDDPRRPNREPRRLALDRIGPFTSELVQMAAHQLLPILNAVALAETGVGICRVNLGLPLSEALLEGPGAPMSRAIRALGSLRELELRPYPGALDLKHFDRLETVHLRLCAGDLSSEVEVHHTTKVLAIWDGEPQAMSHVSAYDGAALVNRSVLQGGIERYRELATRRADKGVTAARMRLTPASPGSDGHMVTCVDADRSDIACWIRVGTDGSIRLAHLEATDGVMARQRILSIRSEPEEFARALANYLEIEDREHLKLDVLLNTLASTPRKLADFYDELRAQLPHVEDERRVRVCTISERPRAPSGRRRTSELLAELHQLLSEIPSLEEPEESLGR